MRWNTGLKVLVDSDISITFTNNFPLRRKARNWPTPVEEKKLPDGSIQWRLKTSNMEPVDFEPYSSPIDYWEGVVFYTPLTPHDLARWYTGLCKGRDQLPPEAKTRLREILAKHQDPEARLQAIMDWVTKDIRYVSLAFKNSSHQPHAVKDTLSRKYGDCKDQSLLVMALCREAGIEAHLVLLGAEFADDPDLDTLSVEKFDHCIVQAITKEHTYYLDPAAGPRKVGSMVREYAGSPALVIQGNKGTVVTLPRYEPVVVNFKNVTIEASPEGGGILTEITRLQGDALAQQKDQFQGATWEKTRRILEEQFKKLGGKVLETKIIQPNEERNYLEAHLKVRLPRIGIRLANGFMLQMGQTPVINPEIFSEERRQPFRFQATDTHQSIMELVLPEGAKLADPPESIEISEPFLKASRKFTFKDNVLRLEEHFQFLTARLPASDNQRVRDTFRRWQENRTMAHRVELPPK